MTRLQDVILRREHRNRRPNTMRWVDGFRRPRLQKRPTAEHVWGVGAPAAPTNRPRNWGGGANCHQPRAVPQATVVSSDRDETSALEGAPRSHQLLQQALVQVPAELQRRKLEGSGARGAR